MTTASIETMTIQKKILILMPFEGEFSVDDEDQDASPVLERFYNIMFKRLKYIIESRIGSIEFRGLKYMLSANVFLTSTGSIQRDALRAVKDSDLVIAYINALNSTVIFELTARTMLRAEWILILDETFDEELKFVVSIPYVRMVPFYLRTVGYTALSGKNNKEIFRDILRMAKDPAYVNLVPYTSNEVVQKPFLPSDYDSPLVPLSLKNLINTDKDAYLEAQLMKSLKELVEKPRGLPEHIQAIMEELDPEWMITNASTYYPSVNMKYTWYPKDSDRDYTDNDLVDEDALACDWNPEFTRLFGFANLRRGVDKVTDTMLHARLKKYVDENDLAEFEQDQLELTHRIIYGNDIGVARVPIRFNNNHPDPWIRKKHFLPCVVMKKEVGRKSSIHYLYTFVIFFEVTNDKNYESLKYDPPVRTTATP